MSEKENLASLMHAAFPRQPGWTEGYPDGGFDFVVDGWPPLTIFVDDDDLAFIAARLFPLPDQIDDFPELLLRLLELNRPGELAGGGKTAVLDEDVYLITPLRLAGMTPDAFRSAISRILSDSGAVDLELREFAAKLESEFEAENASEFPAPSPERGFRMGAIRV